MTPKQAQKILKKHGTIVTEQEAKLIVGFLSELAEISVSIHLQSLKKEKNEFDSSGGVQKKKAEKTKDI